MSEVQKFKCPFCQSALEAGEEALNRRIQCWSCEEKFELSDEIFYAEARALEPVGEELLEEAESQVDLSLLADGEAEKPRKRKKTVKGLKSNNKSRVRTKSGRVSRKSQKKSSTAPVLVLFMALALGGAYYWWSKAETKGGFSLAGQEVSSSVAGKNGLPEAHLHYVPTGVEMKLLNDRCIDCHGATKDGKRIVKGSFDLVPLLQKGVLDENTDAWLNVIEQIESGQMPPEEEKPLKVEESESLVNYISQKLDKRQIPQRLVTSFELLNTFSSVLGFDSRSYDPFERLHFIKNIDSRYPTVNSASLMSSDYLAELEQGVEMAINRHVKAFDYHKKYLDYKDFEIFFYESIAEDIGLTYKDTEAYIKKERAKLSKKKKLTKHDENGLVAAAKVAKPRLNFVIKDKMRLMARQKPQVWENFLPGRYRISFTANGLNRKLVKEQYDKKNQFKGATLQSLDKSWGRDLIYEKMRLSLYSDGWGHGRRGLIIAGAKPGRKIHSFEIKDNLSQKYSFEFELKSPTGLSFEFENGPESPRLHWLRLGEISMKNVKRSDPYPMPHIEISDLVKIEKIGDSSIKSSYDLNRVETSERGSKTFLLKKLFEYSREIGLVYTPDQILALYSSLSGNETEKFLASLKLLSVSPDMLYLDYHSEAPLAKERFTSYALLKKQPTADYIKRFKQFQNGEMSTDEFVKYLSSKEDFRHFLKRFSHYWLEQFVELDKRKYRAKDRQRPFHEETHRYLKYIFDNNRPIKELLRSDYRIVDSSLGVFYELDDNKIGTLKRDHYSLVKLGENQGGVLNQGSFYISQSDGLDALPFKRANWISENVFDRRLATPSGDVNLEVFTANEGAMNFEELTKIHSKNRACAACHRTLDPIAFGIHHFDTIGRVDKAVNRPKVQLLEVKIDQSERKMARAFTKHLISFIIGRSANIYDLKVVEQILDRTEATGFRSRDLLGGIIETYFND